MEKKTDDQLSKIEELLRHLSREVWKLQVARKRLANGEEIDEDLNDEDAIRNSRALSRALTKVSQKQSF